MALQSSYTTAAACKPSQHKKSSWSTVGSSIITSCAPPTLPLEKTRLGRTSGYDTPVKSNPDSRAARPIFTHGVGLTPRLFEALMCAHPAPVAALPSAYLPTISKHVESVAPSKQVFAQYWCPVVVEEECGAQQVLHVDPIVVRRFRRTIAEELQHVREKRKRMLKRIQNIREDFPQIQLRDITLRLQHEISDAQQHLDEPLLQPLPCPTATLHVFLEVTPYMVQLELVCQYLLMELPAVLQNAGVHKVSFSALTGHANGSNDCQPDILPSLAPFDWCDAEAWNVAREWLAALRPQTVPNKKTKRKAGKGTRRGYNFSPAFRWATTVGAFEESTSAIMLLSCSKPLDLDDCIGLARRSKLIFQSIGVFGLSPEDPEPGLQELVDAAPPGSSLRIFFGREYWSKFIAVRKQQIHAAEQNGSADEVIGGQSADEIVSPKVFEMRLIERIMRECYSEEQQCEEELTCATRVFERTLIDNEDIVAVLRGDRSNSIPRSRVPVAPATAR